MDILAGNSRHAAGTGAAQTPGIAPGAKSPDGEERFLIQAEAVVFIRTAEQTLRTVVIILQIILHHRIS